MTCKVNQMFALQFLSYILFIRFGAAQVQRSIGGLAPCRRLSYPNGDVCLDARKHFLRNGALTIVLCRGLVGHMGHRKARISGIYVHDIGTCDEM